MATKVERAAYRVVALDPTTWDAFAELMERNNGVFGGCWCIGFHAIGNNFGSPAENRAEKRRRVTAGTTHAALVLDGDGVAQGWAQFGSPEELPGIKNRVAYEKDAPERPDWRITCVFVDKKHRGEGVARAAVEGALDLIAVAGGGVVEAISEVTEGRKAPGRFLFSGTVELFESLGLTRDRQVGKHAWVVRGTVKAKR